MFPFIWIHVHSQQAVHDRLALLKFLLVSLSWLPSDLRSCQVTSFPIFRAIRKLIYSATTSVRVGPRIAVLGFGIRTRETLPTIV